ncbi:MAG: UDP-N-acetylmuramoyl-L-alanine--D-glutamate ligase [Aerococcus sp.]|nr:UDP-N-acetylmuramoyl-L-alanine--D-glutamate ligase [Aerococcus sp.]
MQKTAVKEKITGKKFLVLGLGKTGLSVAKQLSHLGAEITVNDGKATPMTDEMKALADQYAVTFVLGEHPLSLLDQPFDAVIKNPGIPYTHPMIEKATALALPIITDVEVAGWLSDAMIIGITASNGKTTTSALTAKILSESLLSGETRLGGNIGIPSLDIALDATAADRLVLELSSFQLQGTTTFHPHIAALMNLYPTHLDYHGTMSDYLQAKWHITANQTASDYLLLNADQPLLWEKRTETKATIIPISLTHPCVDPIGAWYDETNKTLNWGSEVVSERANLALPGDHNVQNALNAIAVAKLLQVDNATIQRVLQQFRGVKHRIQWVGDFEQRSFYNDSKATNNEAALTALNSFERPIVWIAGGLNRHIPLTELKPAVKKHVKALVVMGENAPEFESLAKACGITTIEHADWVEDAVKKAYTFSAAGDVILLSPASASWDQYPSFEVRGDRFIAAVEQFTTQQDMTTEGDH